MKKRQGSCREEEGGTARDMTSCVAERSTRRANSSFPYLISLQGSWERAVWLGVNLADDRLTNTAFPATVRIVLPLFRSSVCHFTGWNWLIAVCNASTLLCLYRSVELGYLCPAKACTILRSLFLFNRLVITLCRMVIAFTFLGL